MLPAITQLFNYNNPKVLNRYTKDFPNNTLKSGFLALAFRRYVQESPLWLQAKANSLHQTEQKNFWAFFKHYKWLMFLAFILAVLKLGTYWTCYTWLPRFVSESFGQQIGKSALWILLGQLGQFIGMYIFGYVADLIGRRFGFTIFSMLTAIVLFVLAVFWYDIFTQHVVLFWLLIFLLGLGSGCTPGFGAMLAEIFPTHQRTFAMGTVYNLARGVQILSPVFVGMAVERAGLMGGLLVPTALACLTAVWVWLLPERKAKPLPDVYLMED